MIEVYTSPADMKFVWATDLHRLFGVKTKLSTWFKSWVDYGFEDGKDFIRRHNIKNHSLSDSQDWAITIEMAKHIAMMQKTQKGKEIRDYLLSLDKKLSEGEFLNKSQIMALFDICKVIGYFSVQQHFEQEHYIKFIREKGTDWWDERARLFGYTASELKDAMKAIGKRYVNQRQAIFLLDRYDLVRIGVTEIFVLMGKSRAYAKNVGNIAKDIAKEIKSEVYNDLNSSIDFKSEEQNSIIDDLKKYESIGSVILQKFSKNIKPQVNSNYNQLNLKLNENI